MQESYSCVLQLLLCVAIYNVFRAARVATAVKPYHNEMNIYNMVCVSGV